MWMQTFTKPLLAILRPTLGRGENISAHLKVVFESLVNARLRDVAFVFFRRKDVTEFGKIVVTEFCSLIWD